MKKKLKNVLTYLLFMGLGFGIAITVNFVFHPCMVIGDSMTPTCKNGNICIAKPITYSEVKRNDIVVFEEDDKLLIKRAIGLPGESIAVSGGRFYINGDLLEESFPLMDDSGLLKDTGLILASDELFCVGDNRNNSLDSRFYGPVTPDELKYIVVKTLNF